ncbi:MAG: metallophosphoesterase family protein [Erysipelotrichaceae bacterium]|nr:metallophosphoesterase family protein [Erysipelotrichaceae bacterium]
MKILTIADEECPALWDYYRPGRLDGYDLIISCGDLKSEYLRFLATMARVPVLYVHGNHDGHYENSPPEGCECIDGQYVIYRGYRILGLGGCLRYRPGPHQFTEAQMRRRIWKLLPAIWFNGGVDLIVTHAPPRGLGDLEDPAHRGFQTLRDLITRYPPAILLHGHTHLRYSHKLEREELFGQTRVINAGERYVLELGDRPLADGDDGRLIWKTRHKDPGDDWDPYHL